VLLTVALAFCGIMEGEGMKRRKRHERLLRAGSMRRQEDCLQSMLLPLPTQPPHLLLSLPPVSNTRNGTRRNFTYMPIIRRMARAHAGMPGLLTPVSFCCSGGRQWASHSGAPPAPFRQAVLKWRGGNRGVSLRQRATAHGSCASVVPEGRFFFSGLASGKGGSAYAMPSACSFCTLAVTYTHTTPTTPPAAFALCCLATSPPLYGGPAWTPLLRRGGGGFWLHRWREGAPVALCRMRKSGAWKGCAFGLRGW